jgi:hypothetical protein
MSYETFQESYKNGEFKYDEYRPMSYVPYTTYYRNNPFSEKSYIKPNIAGYYPIKNKIIQKTIEEDLQINHPFFYPSSTIFPVREEEGLTPMVEIVIQP